MYLLTEAADNLVTENSNLILADYFVTCGWPTLAEVKLELGSADDVYLQRQINATIASIEKYIGRKLPREVDDETFHVTLCDTAIGCGTKLQLRRWPVVEVIECVDDDTNEDVSYTIDEYGLLCGDFQLESNIRVKYYGGLECPLPDDLIDVFYQIITSRYASKQTSGISGEVKSESIPGVIKIDYFQDSSNTVSAGSDPATYSYILDLYRSYYV